MTGSLVVVATPIGNFDDISLRAVAALRDADAILAEDTRRTGILLKQLGVSTRMHAFHAHTSDEAVAPYVARIAAGETLALVTDAGTPLVSDPGARLVRAVADAGLRVTTTPGPSAPIAALTICGLRADRFRFVGFLPRSGSSRREAFETLAADPLATVLFESPRRLESLLTELDTHIGERLVAVCREVTKVHEEVVRGTASSLLRHFGSDARGEITVVVEASEPTVGRAEVDTEEFIAEALASGERPREIARRLARVTGSSGQEAYAAVLAHRRATGR